MDEIDAEIIRILCKDARTSFSKIGRMLGIGTDTVFRRFKRLEKDGKISGSTIVLSSKAIGIKGWCGLFLKLQQGSSPLSVKNKLTELKQLYAFVQILGEYDFYLEIGFRDFEELDAFVNQLREVKEIVAIDPMLYATHDWPLPTLNTLDPEVLNWLLNIKQKSI